MGLDKLRLISESPACPEFLQEINDDLMRLKDDRTLEVGFKNIEDRAVWSGSRCWIKTRKGIRSPFFFEPNYSKFKGMRKIHILEVNPNQFHSGYQGLCDLTERVFGKHCPDLRISRIDLNADIEISVDYFYRTIRIPRKRKSSGHELNDPETRGKEKISRYCARGLTGFYVGRKPDLLRVYDKREELKSARKEVSHLPDVWTRLEREYHHGKCPVRYFSELPGLVDFNPFESVEILETAEIYDFHNHCEESRKKYLFNRLSHEFGTQEATRILNKKRNLKRDFEGLLFDCRDIKERLRRSYSAGIERLFNNESADFIPEPRYDQAPV